MKLRSQLALAFFVLAVLPLGGIVLYSYYSSRAAFRQAVEEESMGMAHDMETRLAATRDEFRIQVESLADLATTPAAAEASAIPLAQLAERLSEKLPWLEGLEFVPQPPPAPPAAPAAKAVPPVPPLPPVPPTAPAIAPPAPQRVYVHLPDAAGKDEEVAIDAQRARAQADTLRANAERLAAQHERALMSAAVEGELADAQRRAVEEGLLRTKKLLGSDVACPIMAKDKVLGEVRAQVRAKVLLGGVLGSVRRDQGEIPFAVDAEGRLYALSATDEQKLTDLPIGAAGSIADRALTKNWIVVTRREPQSGLRFGVARPVRESLETMRRAAARNFAYGLGLIALAFAGVFPLSKRMTRNLSRLTAGVERIAHGDLAARVDIRSQDEFGALAQAFNRMTADLSRHQERLLEEERLGKEREISLRLLEAENRRRGDELEEARRFQLSLLPRALPERSDLTLAASTATATEVGGDYYDLLECASGSLALAIGDATGHGAAAGTMVTVVKGLFTAQAGALPPAAFLAHANETVRAMRLGRMAMALTVARLEGRRLTIAAAGMPPVLIHRRANGRVEEIALEGLPLGARPGVEYREASIELQAGDTALLLTDGLPELPNPAGEPLGYPRVEQAFAAGAPAAPHGLLAHLATIGESWRGERALHDDVTFLALQAR